MTLLPYILLAVFAAVTFLISFLVWISGVQGGSAREPRPWMTTVALTAVAAGIMYAADWIP